MAYRPEANWLDKYHRWQLNAYNDNGLRKSFSSSIPGRSGKRVCQEKADEWIRSGAILTSETVGYYLDGYCTYLKQYATISDYRPRCTHIENHIRPVIGDIRLARITEANWESILRRAVGKGLSHKYISNIRSTIIHFCGYAKKRKLLSSIPELETRMYKNATRGKRRILSPHDIDILFSPDHENYLFAKNEVRCSNICLFRVYVLSGFRPGEALGLKKEDINLKDHTITISRSINFYGEITAGKTENAQRTICMMPQLEAVIVDQINRTAYIGSEYVFPDQYEARIGLSQRQAYVHKDWQRWASFNIENYCSLYELRHTLYSYAKNHLSEERLKEYFGHTESMNSSEVYGHAVYIELQRTAGLLTQVFGNLLPANALYSSQLSFL